MKTELLLERTRSLAFETLPLAGRGKTYLRLRRLWEVGAESLSLAKLVEAHWDAVSILAEADRAPMAQSLYAVWASEAKDQQLQIRSTGEGHVLDGIKAFASGVGIVDCALVTADRHLVEVDLRQHRNRYSVDLSRWSTEAFRATQTGAICFNQYPLSPGSCIQTRDWYIDRPGFWHGACGPAACWAGGAETLLAYAEANKRDDPHTRVHRGAIRSAIWAMDACLRHAAAEMDASPTDTEIARIRSLKLRHIVEQHCTDIMRRLTRAFGPHPLAFEPEIAEAYYELDLYLRQSHAERDLEQIGIL